jgi:hypothetical protein
MDIVYLVRPGDQNEELRYSLRTLQHIPHDNVFMAGYRPTWVSQAVTPIAVYRHWDKYKSSTQNMEAACRSPFVSDPFILFNDDFFLLRRMEEVPTLHRGTVSDVLADYQNRYADNGPYVKGMERTQQLLRDRGFPEPISYELHFPLIVHKEPMLEAVTIGSRIRAFHKRTYYGNIAQIGGTHSEDFKIRSSDPMDRFLSLPLVSTSDSLFCSHPIGSYIRNQYSDRSLYEKPPMETVPATRVGIRRAVRVRVHP